MSGYLITRILNHGMPSQDVYADDGFFHRLMDRVNKYRIRRKTIAALNSLDDHMLADIGITRGEITQAVDGLVHRGNKTVAKQLPKVTPTNACDTLKLAA